MSDAPHRLPGWATAVLVRLLPAGVRGASIRGDLAQEWSERARGPGRQVWLAVEVARFGFHYGVRAAGRGGGGMEGAWGFAVRKLRRDPGYSALAVGTIALGIGVTVALYSVVQAVLLDPLPWERPDELVALFEGHEPRDVHRNVVNPGNLRAWRESGSLAGVEGVMPPQPRIVSSPGEPREVMASFVTPGYLTLLGVEPVEGGGFSPGAGGEDGDQIVLTRRGRLELFGDVPEVVGRTVEVNGASARVMAVLDDGHLPFADGALILTAIPLAELGDQTNTGRFLYGLGRLPSDGSIGAAQAELSGVMAGLRERHPEFNAGWRVEVESLRTVLLGDLRAPLWTLLAASGLLLLVSCVSVANLTLARATERRAELAVRSALGASSRAIAGQLMVENLTLAAAGGALGTLIAWVGATLLTPQLLTAFTIPRLGAVGLDGGVLLFAALVTGLTGLAFGLVPSFAAGRASPAATLRAEGRGPGRATGRLRSALVVAEVALSVVLLTSAALLVRSFRTLVTVETGFDVERVVTGRVNLTGERYRGSEPDRLFFTQLERELATLPGVEAAGGVQMLPLDGLGSATSFYAADGPVPPREEWPVADIRPIIGAYFEAMGIDLLAGRTFGPEDGPDTPRTVVVSRSLADEVWPGLDPIGRPLAINWDDLDPWTVVGVVDDVVHAGMDQAPRPMVYHTVRQAPYFPFMSVVLRTRAGGEGEAVGALRALVAELDPALPVTRVRTLDDFVRTATARPRVTAFLMTLFAGAAALLAAVGVYGVLAYSVARRVREIGVRVALGARGRDVVALVTAQGVRLVLAGLAIGLAVAAVAARLLESLLFGVAPRDPVAFGGAALLFVAVGVLACLGPALRAIRIRPVRALREG